jgi:hypothetical protein
MSSGAVQPPGGTNTLGNVSLGLGVASASLVFGLGLCAVVGARQGWIRLGATPLFICGGASAFLGALAFFLGVAGLFGANRPRATALAGAALGLVGACLFWAVVNRLGGG